MTNELSNTVRALEVKLRTSKDESKIYRDLVNFAVSQKDFLKTIKKVLVYAKNSLKSDEVHLLLLNDKQDYIVKRAGIGKEVTYHLLSNIKVAVTDESLIKNLIMGKKSHVSKIKKGTPLAKTIENENIDKSLIVPLKSGDNVIGFLIFSSYKKIKITESDRRVAERIGKRIGSILSISLVRNQLSRKIKDISVYDKISKEMTLYNIDSLMKMVVTTALERINAVSGSIMLINGDILEAKYAKGKGIRKNIKDIKFKIGEGAAGRVAKTKEIIIIENKVSSSAYIDVGSNVFSTSSYIGIPLLIGDEVLGVLNLDYKESTDISEEDLEFLNLLATSASLAIRNTQFYNHSIRRLNRLTAVYEVTKTISATLNLENVLDLIVTKIVKIVKAKTCSVLLLNKEKTKLVPKSVYNLSGDYLKRGEIDIKKSLSGESLRSKEILFCEDIFTEKRYFDQSYARRFNLRSFISIPLVIEDKGIGVINIYSKKKRNFTENELDFLKGFADQAAIAIEKAILYRHIKKEREKLDSLLTITKEVSECFNFEKLLNILMRRSMELSDSDAGSLLMVEGNTLRVHTSIGYPKKIQNIKFSMNEGISGQVVKEEKAIIVNDVSKNKHFKKGIAAQKSEAAFPIKVSNKIFAVLNLDSKVLNNYEKYTETLQILMSHIQSAIENTWLHQRTKNFNVELKDKVKNATKSLLKANDRLVKLDKIKSDFVNNVSHELRTPLTSILGYTKLILAERLGSLNDVQKESLNIVVEESERLTRLINDVLDLSKLEKGNININLIKNDINELIKSSLDTLLPSAVGKKIEIIHEAGTVGKYFLDSDKIKQVIYNLVNNAIRFTDIGGKIIIKSYETSKYVIFEVTDNGCGIKKENISKLFNKFYQVDPTLTKISGGTGLGLPIAQNLVKMHLGEIKIKSEVGKGSSFTVHLSKNLNPDKIKAN